VLRCEAQGSQVMTQRDALKGGERLPFLHKG